MKKFNILLVMSLVTGLSYANEADDNRVCDQDFPAEEQVGINTVIGASVAANSVIKDASFTPEVTVSERVKAFVEAAKVQKNAVVKAVKEVAQKVSAIAQEKAVQVKAAAQDVAKIAQAKATEAKVAAEFVMNNPQAAVVAAKDFVLAHKKQVAGSALVALVAYKAARACGPLAPSKHESSFKSAAKVTAAGALAAACAILSFDKFAGLTLPVFIKA